MKKGIQGNYSGKGRRFVIIVSRFNEFITEHMLDACVDTLQRHDADQQKITIVRVPGAMEIPTALKRVVARRPAPDAVICLGCIIRGDTPHFDHVASESSRGIAEIARASGIPVAFGVIAANTLEQALERAGTKMGNKGRDAAMVALEMANLLDKI
jgi:6,7-dimethyl-8-ribityllumazine synthase